MSLLPLPVGREEDHTSVMTAFLVIVLALVLLDIAVIAGWTADSRDGRDWWRQEWPSQRSRPDVRPVSD